MNIENTAQRNTGHAPAVKDSRQLQRLLGFLTERAERGATTLELHTEANIMAPGTAVSKLRNFPNFIPVKCVFECTTDQGSRVYRYTLEEFAS